MKLQYRTQDGLSATAELVTQDGGLTYQAADTVEDSLDFTFGTATVDGRNFVTQVKNGQLQVLAETNTPTKAARIAEALNAAAGSF